MSEDWQVVEAAITGAYGETADGSPRHPEALAALARLREHSVQLQDSDKRWAYWREVHQSGLRERDMWKGYAEEARARVAKLAKNVAARGRRINELEGERDEWQANAMEHAGLVGAAEARVAKLEKQLSRAHDDASIEQERYERLAQAAREHLDLCSRTASVLKPIREALAHPEGEK